VIDGETKQPVKDFVAIRRHIQEPLPVAVRRIQSRTDVTEGNSSFIYIYAKGYAPKATTLVAWALNDKKSSIIELAPAKPLLGQLIDAHTAKPMANVSVLYGVFDSSRKFDHFFWPERDKCIDGNYSLSTVQRATTDERGNFWFCESPDGEKGSLFIITPGYERIILHPQDRPQPIDGVLQIELAPEATISGTLLKDGKLLSNADISVWKQAPRGNVDETFERLRTDAEGRFRLGSLAAGKYGISYWTQPTRNTMQPKTIASVVLSASELKILGPVDVQATKPTD